MRNGATQAATRVARHRSACCWRPPLLSSCSTWRQCGLLRWLLAVRLLAHRECRARPRSSRLWVERCTLLRSAWGWQPCGTIARAHVLRLRRPGRKSCCAPSWGLSMNSRSGAQPQRTVGMRDRLGDQRAHRECAGFGKPPRRPWKRTAEQIVLSWQSAWTPCSCALQQGMQPSWRAAAGAHLAHRLPASRAARPLAGHVASALRW